MGFGFITIAGLLFGAGITAALFLAGLATGPSSTLTTSPGGSGSDPSCDTLCKTWNAWRSAACAAMAASAAMAAALTSANKALASASTTAALILAGAVAASLIPVFGSAIAGPLFAAYAAAMVSVVFLTGRQVAASQAASAAASDVATKLAGVASARSDLMTRCADAAAIAKCLATPPPCPGV
jgi:hypothetical protein